MNLEKLQLIKKNFHHAKNYHRKRDSYDLTRKFFYSNYRELRAFLPSGQLPMSVDTSEYRCLMNRGF